LLTPSSILLLIIGLDPATKISTLHNNFTERCCAQNRSLMALAVWRSSSKIIGFCEGSTSFGILMGLTEALEEAYRRWGEAAAGYKDRSRQPTRYEVGYFKRRGDGLVFYVMGGGSSHQNALKKARKSEAIGWQGEVEVQSTSRLGEEAVRRQ
jgi:hypothetical protein